MVHKGAKWTMGIGGIVLLVSLIFIVFGVVGLSESEPEDYWAGTAPTEIEISLSDTNFYPVYAEDVNTTIRDANSEDWSDTIFIECNDDDAWDTCGYKTEHGLYYVGDIEVLDAKNDETYTLEISGNGAVQIKEVEFETEDILAMGFGSCACCLGGITLLVGIILAFTLKEKGAHSNVVMVDPATGQLISHQQQAYAPGGAVVVQQQQPVVADPGLVHYNELLSQGYDPSKAESYARMRYPDFKRP